jgi:hypothetical protein
MPPETFQLFPPGTTVAERIQMYVDSILSVPLAAIPAEVTRLEAAFDEAAEHNRYTSKDRVALRTTANLLRRRLTGTDEARLRKDAAGWAELLAS